MLKIDISEATNAMRREFRDLTGREFRTGVARALNHTAAKAKTQASREIRGVYRIKAKDLNPSIKVSRTNGDELQSRVVATGKNLALHSFGAKQNKRGVSVNIMGQRKTIRSAFIARMKSGHIGVFGRGQYKGGKFEFRNKRIRKSGNDLGITEMTTVSVPIAFQNRKVLDAVTRGIQADFPKRLQHELMRIRR